MSFDKFDTAIRFRDVVRKIVRREINDLRPSDSYATVTAVDRTARTATVQFPGETGTITVPCGSIQPRNVGQVVRIGGGSGDRYVSDVLGPAYTQPIYGTAAERTAWTTPYRFAQWIETDTGKRFVYYGSTTGWRPGFWNEPWGAIGSARRAGDGAFTLINAGVETDVLGMGTVEYVKDRVYRLSAQVNVYSPQGATNSALRFYLGATLWNLSEHIPHPTTGHAIHIIDEYRPIVTQSMATKITLIFSINAGYLTTMAGDGRSATIFAEDIGPATANAPSS